MALRLLSRQQPGQYNSQRIFFWRLLWNRKHGADIYLQSTVSSPERSRGPTESASQMMGRDSLSMSSSLPQLRDPLRFPLCSQRLKRRRRHGCMMRGPGCAAV